MLRFIFDDGNNKIEELTDDGRVISVYGSDEETIEGYFSIWKKAGRNKKIQTLSDLNEILDKYYFKQND